jgi:O-antigen ligase
MPAASPVDWGTAAMLVAALLSLLATEYPKQSLRELRWLIVEPLMVFYIARATIANAQQIRVTLWSVVAAGAAASLIALSSLAIQGSLFSPLARATEPYLSPNHLGLFLGRAGAVALALALFAPGALSNRPRIGRAFSWFGLAAIGAGMIHTLSLGAWGGVGASALVVSALKGRRWLALTAAGLALLLLAGVATLPAGRTTGRLDPTTGTALFRVQIWTSSLRMIADHPLLGVGLDNFLYRYRDGYMQPEAAEEPNISHPHNWLLHFWLELGLLGVAAVVGLLAWAGSVAWRLVRTPGSPGQRLVGAAAVGVFVDTLVHGSVDNSYFLVDAAVVWWLFLALFAICSQSAEGAHVRSGGAVEFAS